MAILVLILVFKIIITINKTNNMLNMLLLKKLQ